MENYFISFERSGGFAGLSQSIELKTDTLSMEERGHLSKLVESSGFFNLKPEASTGLPDQFNYSITIKSSSSEKTLNFTERNIPSSMRPLVDFLTKKMRKR